MDDRPDFLSIQWYHDVRTVLNFDICIYFLRLSIEGPVVLRSHVPAPSDPRSRPGGRCLAGRRPWPIPLHHGRRQPLLGRRCRYLSACRGLGRGRELGGRCSLRRVRAWGTARGALRAVRGPVVRWEWGIADSVPLPALAAALASAAGGAASRGVAAAPAAGTTRGDASEAARCEAPCEAGQGASAEGKEAGGGGEGSANHGADTISDWLEVF